MSFAKGSPGPAKGSPGLAKGSSGPAKRSPGLAKRSVMIAGHRTSVSLEAPFWEALREIAAGRGQSVQVLIGEIDAGRGEQNLSSAIRVFVLAAVRQASEGAPAPNP